MAEETNPFMNRRQLARSAMIGSAGLMMGAAAMESQQPQTKSGLLDVQQFGAAGDGKTDDTAALQRALDTAGANGSGVLIPPGIYMTRELYVRAGTALIGTTAWNYSGGGGSILRLASADAKCLLNLTEARGATVHGLALEGRELGNGLHGIATLREKWGAHEDGFRIESCQVGNFTGDGAHLECVWCFSVRHCEFGFNHGDGLSLRGWDGFLLDNWFSGNKGAGFAARRENASVTFTANRIEWNGAENFVIVGGDGYQITGNFFDRAGTCGIALRKGQRGCTQVTITGNFIKRSGKMSDGESHDSCGIFLDGCTGVTCIGNNLQSGRDDGNAGMWSPAYGIVYQGLQNCVVRDNVLHDGALKQLMVDLGGQGEGVIVSDNPGRLFVAKK